MRTASCGQVVLERFRVLSFIRAGAIVAGVTPAGLSAAPAFATGDPAGNNGTVKIEEYLAPDDAPDTTPENDPHQGCKFDNEWYGFDEGVDIISKVSFEMQAPTLESESDSAVPAMWPLLAMLAGAAAAGTALVVALRRRAAALVHKD